MWLIHLLIPILMHSFWGDSLLTILSIELLESEKNNQWFRKAVLWLTSLNKKILPSNFIFKMNVWNKNCLLECLTFLYSHSILLKWMEINIDNDRTKNARLWILEEIVLASRWKNQSIWSSYEYIKIRQYIILYRFLYFL